MDNIMIGSNTFEDILRSTDEKKIPGSNNTILVKDNIKIFKKFILSDNEDSINEILKDDPNIPYLFGVKDKYMYLQYIEGKTLSEICNSKYIDQKEQVLTVMIIYLKCIIILKRLYNQYNFVHFDLWINNIIVYNNQHKIQQQPNIKNDISDVINIMKNNPDRLNLSFVKQIDYNLIKYDKKYDLNYLFNKYEPFFIDFEYSSITFNNKIIEDYMSKTSDFHNVKVFDPAYLLRSIILKIQYVNTKYITIICKLYKYFFKNIQGDVKLNSEILLDDLNHNLFTDDFDYDIFIDLTKEAIVKINDTDIFFKSA